MPEENAEQQKPVGPFEDFEACVRHFEGDDQVDDPEALCGWMEENQEASAVQEYQPSEDEVEDLVAAMKEPGADTVLTDLEVTFVSGVGDPAQDSQWVMAKDASAQGADWGVTAPLVLAKGSSPVSLQEDDGVPAGADEGEQEGTTEQQKAWAPVLIPNETDKQGDVIPPEAIEKAAHTFLGEYRNIDTDHDLLEGKGIPIESWTLKEESTFTLPDGEESRQYPKGTWMLGVRFNDESWERVKSGDLSGFSIYGEATEHSVQELLGGGVDVAMGGTTTTFQATAKEADSGTSETMSENENPPEDGGNENEAKDGEGGSPEGEQPEGGEDQPTLKELQETMESTHDTVKSVREKQEDHGDRLEALEAEVFEKENAEDEGEGEGEQESEPEKEQPEVDPDEIAEQATEAATEAAEAKAEQAAEAQVKNLLGIDGDLPEGEDERREVLRKHLHEEPEDSGLGSPDDWSEDEVSEVVR